MEDYECGECGSKIRINQKIEGKTINLPSAKYRVDTDITPHVRYEMETKELVFFHYGREAIELTLKNIITKFVQNNEIKSVKVIKAEENKLNKLDPHELKVVIDEDLDYFVSWVAEFININIPIFSVELKD